MLVNRKRKLDETNLEGKDDHMQKRAKELWEEEVKRSNDMFTVSINKMTPDERKLNASLFTFPILSADLNCNIWDVDISKSVKVVCAECYSNKISRPTGRKDTPFISCLECFGKGKEKGDHKKEHSYSILDKLDYPLFDTDWSALEDIYLLKGISMSGIDNWYQISEMLGTKSPTDWEAHFYSFYYKSMDDPIPRVEEIGTLNRNKDNEPALKEEVLEENKKKKEKYLSEKYKDKGKRDQRSKSHKNDQNSDDNAKKQGKCIAFFYSHISLRFLVLPLR